MDGMTNRNLSQAQFLHGTSHPFEEGDLVEPTGRDGRAYFTHSEYEANAWARRKSMSQGMVYPVEPTGEYHKDPYSQGFRSAAPLRVVGPGRPAPDTATMRAMARTYRPPRPPHTADFAGTEEAYRYAMYD